MNGLKKLFIVSCLCLLTACTSKSIPTSTTAVFSDEVTIEKVSDIYPELFEACTSQMERCLINGGSKEAIYFAKYEEDMNTIQSLNRFDRNSHEITILIDYEENQDIHLVHVIELGDMLVYTQETPYEESKADAVQYSIKALKNGQSILLDSGVYPNTLNTISMHQVGNSVIYSTLDYEKNDAMLINGNGKYGYKIGKIDKTGHVEVIDSYYTEVEEFIAEHGSHLLWSNKIEYPVSSFFLSAYEQGNDTILTYYDEAGEATQASINELCIRDYMGVVGWYKHGFLLNEPLKADLYLKQNNYTFYDFEDHEWFDLGAERAMTYAIQCSDDVFYARADNGSKHHYGDMNYLVTASKDGIVFKSLDLGEYDETYFNAMNLTDNQILLFNRVYCPDAFLISY